MAGDAAKRPTSEFSGIAKQEAVMLMEIERESVVAYGQRMSAAGLTTGSGGNLSVINRKRGWIAVSPTGVPYEELNPGDVPLVDLAGTIVDGGLNPSSELAFHLIIYNNRADVGAVVHTHSVYASAMACLRREIPPIHYLIGFAGRKVPVAPYATFGTNALARGLMETLGSEFNGVLLANHGVVTVGSDLRWAFTAAESVEYVARLCLITSGAGEPEYLSDDEMARVIKKFESYGRPRLETKTPRGGLSSNRRKTP
jgi:L-fuculose-phosphate aldolase